MTLFYSPPDSLSTPLFPSLNRRLHFPEVAVDFAKTKNRPGGR